MKTRHRTESREGYSKITSDLQPDFIRLAGLFLLARVRAHGKRNFPNTAISNPCSTYTSGDQVGAGDMEDSDAWGWGKMGSPGGQQEDGGVWQCSESSLTRWLYKLVTVTPLHPPSASESWSIWREKLYGYHY